MEPIKDQSYGVIPFFKTGDTWQVFLIYQYGSGGDLFWTFPKGHPDPEESAEAAARRELFEETGLELAVLHPNKTFAQRYTFFHQGTEIDKSVTYFLGVVAEPTFTIQTDEVKEAGWFTIEQAANQLTHEPAKVMLTEAVTTLHQLYAV